MLSGSASISSSMSGFGGTSKQLLMAEHIFRKGLSLGWFPDQAFGIVVVRSGLGSYVTFPPEADVEGVDELLLGVKGLNCEVAVVITSNVVRGVVDSIPDDKEAVPLKSQHHLVQVLDNLDELASAKRHQHAAFIRNDRSLVVWSDQVQDLVGQVQAMHDSMIAFVWDFKSDPNSDPYAFEDGITTETEKRKVMKLSPILVGLCTGLNIFICCLSIRTILIEYFTDQGVMRLIILASIPLQFCVLQFFTSAILTVAAQILAPVKQISENSRYFSGVAPKRITGPLPHFTVQMPVYKEGLESVLKPTIQSVQRAMKTYELQGGSTSLLICDDGMQLLDEEELAIRKEYYDLNSIAYVARPPHSAEFVRAGRFKKASNLNFALELSIRVEEMMNERRPATTSESSLWTNDQEESLYKEVLAQALIDRTKMMNVKEYPEGRSTGNLPKGRKAKKEEKEKRKREEAMVVEKETAVGPWCAGNIRMGEFVLLIDSDTRIPEDCFIDAASEMRLSPDVAILQHYSDVMYVARHYFENGIAFFTRMVNLSISWVCSNGDVAPFVGHNAFLRWSALQEVATEEAGGRKQIWSETHVSEDFDMALRLLRKGYVVRWCTYALGGFQEGVSLTADDEINRWQKYAFGVSELIFQPFWKWPFKGPLTPQIIGFLVRSSLPIHYKFSSFAYMMSYYAIGVAWPLSILNFALYGLFIPTLDLAYVPAWNITLGLLVVFSAASSVSFSVLRFRSGDCGILRALFEQFMWLPFFLIFFGGLSFHVSMALFAHMFGINMTWSATVKDNVASTVFREIPAIWKRFWIVLTLMTVVLVGVIILSTPLIPMEWVVIDWIAIFPLMMVVVPHILYPIALNPYITRFRF
ncbi:glycosyl transferase family group 2-domain-containing protein [Mrakia frigida]|uniref:glycosyltransferase family 2 protein n=1 Tax=Mrakia frigida TaxID=29902 RepID=UPI003FCC084A